MQQPSLARPLHPQASVEEVMQAIQCRPVGPPPPNWHLWENVQEAHRRLADDLLAGLTVPTDTGRGRGIVTAGGGALFPSLWVLLHSLKEVGCSLPVEVWYKGDQEMCPEMKRLLAPLAVSL